jgi:hypothetical protein
MIGDKNFTDDQVVDAFVEFTKGGLTNEAWEKAGELVKKAFELRSDYFVQKMIERYLKAPGGECGGGGGCGSGGCGNSCGDSCSNDCKD